MLETTYMFIKLGMICVNCENRNKKDLYVDLYIVSRGKLISKTIYNMFNLEFLKFLYIYI